MEQKRKYWLQWGTRFATAADELSISTWLKVRRRELRCQK